MSEFRTSIQDLIEQSPLKTVLFTRHRWPGSILGALVAVLLGLGTAWLMVESNPLIVLALLLGLGYVVLCLGNLEIAYAGVIALVTLLPFGSLPFSIGFIPTFLDLALGMLFVTWVLPMALGQETRFETTILGGPVFAFAFFAVGAFIAGLSHGALTPYLIRHFAEVLLSITLFYLVVNTVRDTRRLRNIVRLIILAATAEAAIGIVLYFLPNDLTITLLSALGRFGYPVGSGVLRFIRDDPSLMQRATATSVDPNVLGSLLNVAVAMTIPQLFTSKPVLAHRYLIPMLGIMGLCLGLTISRGTMLGVAAAIFVIAALRYRKLLVVLGALFVLVLILPWTQEYVLHFIEGFLGQDLSTQMRFGEYKDAFILIMRYPLLGVGFAGAPDIDIYIGVANVYLIIAEQMGLVGLAAFFVVTGLLLVRFWKRRELVIAYPELEHLWYGLHAAVIGGLVGGIFDHYFFSLDFHHSVTLFWLVVGLATAATELLDHELRLAEVGH
ncbi:MAG: O-antigen ligase family protein [Anaerolineae bacterium]|nr:O-antigen ligase family protein [Anaerolineae bacterium]